MVNWVKLDRQRLVNKSILMYKIVNNVVPDFHVELNSGIKFDVGTAVARHLKPLSTAT